MRSKQKFEFLAELEKRPRLAEKHHLEGRNAFQWIAVLNICSEANALQVFWVGYLKEPVFKQSNLKVAL